MWTNDEIEDLSSLRLLLKFMNLYNENGVYIRSVRIADFIVFFVVSLSTLHMAVLAFGFSSREKFDLKFVSASLPAAFGFTQITMISI